MTSADVDAMVARIRESKRDYEAAHTLEDEMFVAVLGAIARGSCNDPCALAAAALQSLTIDFARWTA